MKTTSALGGGLAGALALTLLHETVRQLQPKAPRLDLLGMEAIAKLLLKSGERPPDDPTLHRMALAGDVVANSLYYSLAGIGKQENVWLRAALMGLGAGIGAVTLPEPLGLSEKPSGQTFQTKAMTVAWYVAGGLAAAAVAHLLENKGQK
ncbi:MAG: hypothetical protein V4714_04755 [Bacteroidota bacterium]